MTFHRLALALCLLASPAAFALDLVPKYGFEKRTLSGPDERMYGLELRAPLSGDMRVKLELGGWIAKEAGRESAQYVAAEWGYRARTAVGVFVEAFIGPGYLTRPDTRLGSHAQIFHDVNVGLLDAQGYGAALGFRHVSNAGIFPGPNQGRDFGQLLFVIPLGSATHG